MRLPWGTPIAAIIAAFVALISLCVNFWQSSQNLTANRQIAKENQDANKEISKQNQDTCREISKQNLDSTQKVAQQNIEMAKRTLQEKAREEEGKRIMENIDQFYGPFLLLRDQSEFIYYNLFMRLRSDKELQLYKDSENIYRTVIALFKGHKFEGVHAWLLQHIVDIGKKCANLIRTKSGFIDDKELRELLAQAATHYRIIAELFEKPDPRIILDRNDDAETAKTKAAFHEKIEQRAVFTRILTKKVEEKAQELQEQMQSLSKY
jgi:hypothetical protein